MALKPDTAKRKDQRTGLSPMQHRHFASIAAIIADMPDRPCAKVTAHHFAGSLPQTNPNFDRARFLTACNVES